MPLIEGGLKALHHLLGMALAILLGVCPHALASSSWPSTWHCLGSTSSTTSVAEAVTRELQSLSHVS